MAAFLALHLTSNSTAYLEVCCQWDANGQLILSSVGHLGLVK